MCPTPHYLFARVLGAVLARAAHLLGVGGGASASFLSLLALLPVSVLALLAIAVLTLLPIAVVRSAAVATAHGVRLLLRPLVLTCATGVATLRRLVAA